jgi:cell division protein YceG involved in septum cleavage
MMPFHSFCSSWTIFPHRGNIIKKGDRELVQKISRSKGFSASEEGMACHYRSGVWEGITLEQLIERFPEKRCLGIELNKQNVETCRSYRLPVLNGNVYHLSIKTGSADCCLMMDVIEHLDFH